MDRPLSFPSEPRICNNPKTLYYRATLSKFLITTLDSVPQAPLTGWCKASPCRRCNVNSRQHDKLPVLVLCVSPNFPPAAEESGGRGGGVPSVKTPPTVLSNKRDHPRNTFLPMNHFPLVNQTLKVGFQFCKQVSKS